MRQRKRKLLPDFVPKWRRRMPEKHHKKDGEWQPWIQPTPTRSPQTNHERFQTNQALRKEKKAVLRELVKQTKETHPNEKKSYHEWTLLAVQEAQQKLHE